MKSEDSDLLLLKIEDKSKYDDSITYVYAGNDPVAVYKPITVYKEKTQTHTSLLAATWVSMIPT